MTDEELIELTNNIIDCINADGKLPIHSSAVLMNLVMKFKQYSQAKWVNVYEHNGTKIFNAEFNDLESALATANPPGRSPFESGHYKYTAQIIKYLLPTPPTTKGAQE